MAGGLLNIVAQGNANAMLTGNPTKTFFKVTYSKYTNFGLQKFRLDYDGMRNLRLSEESKFTFKVKRYAELLMDTYIVVTLPDIWSTIYHPCVETSNQWASYDFKWIHNIGVKMVKEIEITCGSLVLQRYSGDYLECMIERDFSTDKKDIINRMSGNIPELYNPANAFNNANTYPSAYYESSNNSAGAEPSLRGRTLYIPINMWFCLDSRCAFPLIALQYNELTINVTMRPIRELFTVRDVFDYASRFPYIQPDFTLERFQMYRFLQTPPAVILDVDAYVNHTKTWNADIHLLATYCFLSKDEAALFAMQDQVYLVKDVFEYKFNNVTGSSKVKLNSNGMIANWMMTFQRNDAHLRNEWSNYTNLAYTDIPTSTLSFAPQSSVDTLSGYGPGINPSTLNTGYLITGKYNVENHKDILETMGIVLDGEYRENTLMRGVFDYIEKYTRTQGSAKDGIYCYNYGLSTDPFNQQPSGALNLTRFRTIELEFTTYVPIFNVNNSINVLCDLTGAAIGISHSPSWRTYDYNFDLTVFEERYNVISFIGGNCGMLYAR